VYYRVAINGQITTIVKNNNDLKVSSSYYNNRNYY
jgi:hypothetical protein